MMLTPFLFNKLKQSNDAPLTLSNIIEAKRSGFQDCILAPEKSAPVGKMESLGGSSKQG